MRLRQFKYSEFDGTPEEWVLQNTFLNPVNLLVGKNATGKTRFASAVGSLARLIGGAQKGLFDSANYDAEFADKDDGYRYKLSIAERKVSHEEFSKGNEILFKRDETGAGTIYAVAERRMIQMKAPLETIVANSRQDEVQHPFLEPLVDWATKFRSFGFGTPLGKEYALGLPITIDSEKSPEETDTNKLASLYIRAYQQFGDEFDKAVLRDLDSIGYPCEDVGADRIDSRAYAGPPAVMIFVKEKDLSARTFQFSMSQGMFRVLSLVMHLNYYLFANSPRTVVIDDVGEGLDFSRASAFISLLVSRASKSNLQLIMTTNDRFVMNAVPLEYWGIISRKGGCVRVINKTNNADAFRRFESLGLSNFDFFSMDLFEQPETIQSLHD